MDQNRRDYVELDRTNRRDFDWRQGRKSLRTLAVPLLLLCGLTVFAVGCLVGMLAETKRQYEAKFERDQAALAPVLTTDPAFARVRIDPHSAGGVILNGEVPTTADGARLRAAFVRLFGETQAWRIEVMVRQTGKPVPGQSSEVPPTR
jgi:hypothetical protein